ncbi:hypothetical protein EDB83DRAFT_2683759 [Lactarius deliciosus]|nr:hypothetical protein EDB83DRAFT_2683759 [Lactarius deliciosus]
MSTQIKVLIPLLSRLCAYPHTISYVGELRRAIWDEESAPLRDHGGELPQISLRSLVYPVPLEPEDTLRKRVVDSARGERWTHIKDGEKVPLEWCDPQNVHVYLYVDLDAGMRAAESLYDKLWRNDLSVILEKISDNGNTWTYVPKKHIDSLQMRKLGYPHKHGLLVRPEYDVAWGSLDYGAATANANDQGGVVITGQPGIGKTCFLYYLLFRLLSQGTPVSLQRSSHILVFRDDGVYRHPLDAVPDYLPEGTWALSDAGRVAEKPCKVFLDAAEDTAWIIQTTSPLETRWKEWAKQHSAVTFVMKGFSAEEITALGLVSPDFYNVLWGPSARTCVRLARDPAEEDHHAIDVNNAAKAFVERLPSLTTFDAIQVSHVLFAVRPDAENENGRRISVTEMATEHIKRIISCAAAGAEAQKRVEFFRTISTQPAFKESAGDMFEGFPILEIPTCGKEKTTFFGSDNGVENVNWDELPLCLLPTVKNYPTADAIVITEESVITIQVTVSYKHKAKGTGFTKIEKLISSHVTRDKWFHVFVTDDDDAAASLRDQYLPEVPQDVVIYSAVFDIGRSVVTRENMKAFNEKRLEFTDQQPQVQPPGMEVD